MKKLLTVVLCVAVIFTFSFSGAFATTYKVNDTLAEQYLNDALDAVDGTDGHDDGIWVGDPDPRTDRAEAEVAYANGNTKDTLNVTYDVLVAQKADLLEAAKDWAKNHENEYIGQTDSTTGKVIADQTIVDLVNWLYQDEDAANYDDLYQTLAKAQFDADKAEALAIIDGISFSGVSTKEMSKDCAHTVACETYKEHVQKLVDDLRSEIDGLESKTDTEIGGPDGFVASKNAIDYFIGKVPADKLSSSADADNWTGVTGAFGVGDSLETTLIIQKAYKGSEYWVGLSAYELNEDWKEVSTMSDDQIYYTKSSTEKNKYYAEDNTCTKLGDYLTDNKDADDASKDAKIESLKAQVAAQKAKYLKKNTDTADKEYADNIQEALNYLIEQEEITSDDGFATLLPASGDVEDAVKTKASDAVKYAKELKDEAATLAAETDENGTLIRDKKDVDDLLEEGLTAIYNLGAGKTAKYKGLGNEEKTYDDAKYISTVKEACKSDIEALYVSLDDTKLAYYKQNSISLLNKFYQVYAEDYENVYGIMGQFIGYYTPEKTELKAAVDKAVASIEAATKHQQVDKALETFKKDYDYTNPTKLMMMSGDMKYGVMYKNAEALMGICDDAEEYADLLNDKIKKSDDKYVTGANNGEYEYGESSDNSMKLGMLIADFVGENGARTKTDIDKLNDEAMQLVKTLPTTKTVDDAKDALDDAMKALPSTIKLADADKIDAACAALDTYFDLTCDYVYKIKELENKIVALAYAENNALDEKYDKIDKNDKKALDALQDEIDAFVEKYGKYMLAMDPSGASTADYVENDESEDSNASEWTNIPLETLGNAAVRSIITVDDEISDDLDKIRQDDLDDVKAAINKIPAKANITEESKPVIQAARKAYDAYVQKWTSYEDTDFTWTKAYNKNGGYAADDLASYYQTLTAAEAAAGLNTTSDADLVKELKIVAKSTAKKGSIKVTWKVVEGDASVADGYQVWKSTKHSKGYKKAFTTSKKSYKNTKGLKKGVRYYYKVRAYKVVDGKNVYSDWSNKARRVAK